MTTIAHCSLKVTHNFTIQSLLETNVFCSLLKYLSDIYAALWPFLGIVAEVVILCTIIYIHERRRIRKNIEEADIDNKINDQ